MLSQMISWIPRLLDGVKTIILLTLCVGFIGWLLNVFLALGNLLRISADLSDVDEPTIHRLE